MPVDDELKIAAYVALGLMVLFIFLCGQIILRRRNERKDRNAPASKVVLEQFDDLAPAYAVMLAWTEFEISNERQHRKAKDDVREIMPVLARALDRMVD